MTRLGEAAAKAKDGITLERAIIAIAVALASAPGVTGLVSVNGANKDAAYARDAIGDMPWKVADYETRLRDLRDKVIVLETELRNLKERR